MTKPRRTGGMSSDRISDARFANFETDPRFRLPSSRRTKTKIDRRFASMLQDDDFVSGARVDRYGRKMPSQSKKALERLYQVESEDEEKTGSREPDEVDDSEADDDERMQKELRLAHEKDCRKRYDAARGGGFSSSESDSDSDSDDADEEDDGGAEAGLYHGIQNFQDEQADVEFGEVTSRLAVVNLDCDHVKSVDLMAVFSSFLEAKSGRILKISIYPSDFGKERMQKEEVDGPPKALFKDTAKATSDGGSDSESDDVNAAGDDSCDEEDIKRELMQEGDDQDFDSDALRSYQLDRLRYYYAVMVCSSAETAKQIYDATDGTEFQSSSNVIDLRFIPDDVVMDEEARDECDKLPDSYKPVEFVTKALQSSKVTLTWDMDPGEAARKDSIKRAFGAKRGELQDNDLRAYLASDSEHEEQDDVLAGNENDDGDDDDNDDDDGGAEGGKVKLTRREMARKKMREALGLVDEKPSTRGPGEGQVGDMQITFAPALAEGQPKEAEGDETTLDKYKRKERERKARKMQESKARREGGPRAEEKKQAKAEKGGDDLGFDEPFFTTDGPTQTPTKSSLRKEERRKKREAREAAEAASTGEQARLCKVMADSERSQTKRLVHFDMKEIVQAEKDEAKQKRKGKKGKKGTGESGGELQRGFEIDVEDDRFRAVFDSHEFAIDPSNPKFKATGGMKRLLEEGRQKKRRLDNAGEGDEETRRTKTAKTRFGCVMATKHPEGR